jgi:hypothetical protein
MVYIAGLETARRQLRQPAMFGVALVNPARCEFDADVQTVAA